MFSASSACGALLVLLGVFLAHWVPEHFGTCMAWCLFGCVYYHAQEALAEYGARIGKTCIAPPVGEQRPRRRLSGVSE